MDLYRTTKHENAKRIVLPMRRYRVIDSEHERGKIEKRRVTEKELRSMLRHMH